MSKPSSGISYGIRRKSKWNREVISKAVVPMICSKCGLRRNKFIKNVDKVLICAVCVRKMEVKRSGQTKPS